MKGIEDADHNDIIMISDVDEIPNLNNDKLKNSVNSKKSFGGTSFANIKKMIIKYKKTIQ